MSALPWVQVERDFLSVRALELAGELGTSVPHAAGLMLMLWSWCQARGSGELRGRNWQRSLEIAAGWDGSPGAFSEAVITCGLVESLEDGVRVRGLGRYETARAKAQADRDRLAAKRALGRDSQSHARKETVAATSLRRSGDVGGDVAATSPGRDVRRQRSPIGDLPPVGPPRGDAPAERQPEADLSALAPGDSLRDALESVWLAERGAPYVWGRRDDMATRRLVELSPDAGEILRRWRIGLQRRFPAATCVSDLAKHWNAYAAPEQPAGAAPPSRPRATDGAGAPQPSRPCGVCGEPVERGDTWGQWLCAPDAAACIDAMASEPSSAAAARWVQAEKGGAR